MKLPKLFTPAIFWVSTLAVLPNLMAGEKIPLLITESMYGGQSFVSCDLLGEKSTCKLDTGANISSVRESEKTKDLPTMGTSRYESITGSKVICRDIVIPELKVGSIKSENLTVVSCPNVDTRTGLNILGLDFLANKYLTLNYKSKYVEISDQSQGKVMSPFVQTDVGHVLIPLSVGKKGKPEIETLAMFDTGAALTVVNLKFAQAHPEYFTVVNGNIDGTDTHGNPLNSILMISTIYVGGKVIAAEYVMGIDFTAIHKIFGKEINYIIGHNALKQKTWHLDFINKQWAVE